MPRFSAKAKEIHDQILYHEDLIEANKLLEELKDPLDIAFGKLFMAYHVMLYSKKSEFLELLAEVENENTRLKDQFIQFMINFYYCFYYSGLNIRIVDKEEVEKYLDNIEISYQDID